MSSKLRRALRQKTAKARTRVGLDRALRRVGVRTDRKLVPRPPSSASIRYLRQLLGMTQVMMARQLEVDLLTIKSWENDRRRPTAARTVRLRELAAMNDLNVDLLTKKFTEQKLKEMREKQQRRTLEVKVFGVEEKTA